MLKCSFSLNINYNSVIHFLVQKQTFGFKRAILQLAVSYGS